MSGKDKVHSKKVKTVSYSFVIADLFHYGHLRILKKAKSLADYHICGLITDEAANRFQGRSVTNFEERKAVLESIDCIDRIVVQDSLDPTENLKKLHKEFRDAKIILVHGNDWEHLPGVDYVRGIGGEVVQPDYYKKLTRRRIIEKLSGDGEHNFELFTEHFRIGNILYFSKDTENVISTKADTLQSLQPVLRHSMIEKTFVFTVRDWAMNGEEILEKIREEFAPNKIVIRSSAINEDTFHSSMAGYYKSELDVPSDNPDMIANSIDDVIGTYLRKGSENPTNQVLIQKQVEDVRISGVVFTRVPDTNAPYYVINYDDETGRTDTVTRGIRSKNIEILSFSERVPKKWDGLMRSLREIDDTIPGVALDIEFAINNKGDVSIFQVRPLVSNADLDDRYDEGIRNSIMGFKQKYSRLSNSVSDLGGDGLYLSDMAFWNPAEIIGSNPNYLDYSLYRHIITDRIWNDAILPLGYTEVPHKLMVLFGNKPYINLLCTFNAILPKKTPKRLREKLVGFYSKKLKERPELHDKVEFEVIHNVYDLSFDKHRKELLENGFTRKEVDTLEGILIDLTNDILANSGEIIGKDFKAIEKLKDRRNNIHESLGVEPKPRDLIPAADSLLRDVKRYGTPQFSRLARLAFIGKSILKGLVHRKAVDEEFYSRFLNSINTVATDLSLDFLMLKNGDLDGEDFLRKYGHLRPGTYDITKPRYDKNAQLLSTNVGVHADRGGMGPKEEFVIEKETHKKVSKLLKESGIDCNSGELFTFIRRSIEGRESLKFEFTRNLSDAIELIASAGNILGFSRNELSQLDMDTIMLLSRDSDEEDIANIWRNIIRSRALEKEINEMILLPPLIFSEDDFEVIPSYIARPNFITQKCVKGEIINLDNISESGVPDLKGKIALIENADPGYDWIFTKNLLGLITRYGGVASHMAIRCAEFGIPAAIGCGDSIFRDVKDAENVLLDCKGERVEVMA